MIRNLVLVLGLLVFCSVRAEQAGFSILADVKSMDAKGGDATGNVIVTEGDMRLTTDALNYEATSGTITAKGRVVFTRGPLRLLADRIVYHRGNGTFSTDKVRAGMYPYYVESESADGTREEVTFHRARAIYGEPGPWQPTAVANAITLSTTGRRIRSESAQIGVGGVRPLPFPSFQQSLASPLLGSMKLTGGYRRSLGAFVDGGLAVPVAPGLRLGGDLGYYTARGVLAGPGASYFDPADPERLSGSLHTGFINDHGDKKTDVLGRPVPENRGFVDWEHHQDIGDLTLVGQYHWWRDSEVVRDFRPREFFPVQQPDSFVEASYANPNSLVSAFARVAPNSFEIVQRRTPEIRLDVLPMAIGVGAYQRFNASLANLSEHPLPGDANPEIASAQAVVLSPEDWSLFDTTAPFQGTTRELRTTRVDAYYGLSRPIAPSDWFTLTPVVGGRVTHYMNTRGAENDGRYTRTLGEVGVDAELRSSGTFAYRNPRWDIDGLRHLFTPRISYRYIPEADKGRGHIPTIDRQAFSTYLQPLDLGDMRAVDDLRATNTLRLSFDNVLQTRDSKYGSRDLLTFNVANDFRFKRLPGERDVSAIHTELAAMPARWVELGVYNSFTPQDFSLREFNSGVTFRDGDAWSVRFANNFLKHQLQDYLMDGRLRINEQFEALSILRYDERKHRFTEQSYGLVQNVANTWRISYVVSFYSGRRRESGFGFSVQVDTVRF